MDTAHNQSHKRFPLKIWLPIAVAIAIIIGGAVWFLVAMPFSKAQQHIRQLDTKAKQLYTDHQACVDKLNQDYKELDSNNQEAYQKAYDHCEAIRKEQNKTVDEYNQLAQ